MPIAYQTRTEHGVRNVALAQIRGRQVEVVTAWDINEDTWRYHVYVYDANGIREKVPVGNPFADTMAAAFEAGFQFADQHIP